MPGPIGHDVSSSRPLLGYSSGICMTFNKHTFNLPSSHTECMQSYGLRLMAAKKERKEKKNKVSQSQLIRKKKNNNYTTKSRKQQTENNNKTTKSTYTEGPENCSLCGASFHIQHQHTHATPPCDSCSGNAMSRYVISNGNACPVWFPGLPIFLYHPAHTDTHRGHPPPGKGGL